MNKPRTPSYLPFRPSSLILDDWITRQAELDGIKKTQWVNLQLNRLMNAQIAENDKKIG